MKALCQPPSPHTHPLCFVSLEKSFSLTPFGKLLINEDLRLKGLLRLGKCFIKKIYVCHRTWSNIISRSLLFHFKRLYGQVLIKHILRTFEVRRCLQNLQRGAKTKGAKLRGCKPETWALARSPGTWHCRLLSVPLCTVNTDLQTWPTPPLVGHGRLPCVLRGHTGNGLMMFNGRRQESLVGRLGR